MNFQMKLIAVAVAGVFPALGVFAQTSTSSQSEIAALKAQLRALAQQVDALTAATEGAALSQQVVRIEQRMDLAEDAADQTGFKGLKINGVIEAAYKTNDVARTHNFGASAGYFDEHAMLQMTKSTQGEGVDWTLRMLPGASQLVNEASITVPLDKDNRIIGGLMPDFQGYEFAFANADPTLGNQLLTHNAMFDLATAVSYSGVGMSHTLGGGAYALKWVVGNVDPGYDAAGGAAVGSAKKKTKGVAYRADWFVNEFAYIGLSGVHGAGNREFGVMSVDGGYLYGDWAFNGHVLFGVQERAAANAEQARWSGVSGLIRYKVTPRLQVLVRADFLENRANGGGTYGYNAGGDGATGLGPELDSTGNAVLDASGNGVGANVARVTVGTNYQINANTQWKLELRHDQSTGSNFVDADGNFKSQMNSAGTSIVVSF